MIAIDTAVAHLAGAVGKEVWTMLPFVPDWRWLLDREDSPWYPGMRLFRQDASGTWQPVIERIARELAAKVGAPIPASRVAVQIAPGDLLDRIAALEARALRTKKPDVQAWIASDLAALAAARSKLVAPEQKLGPLTADLQEANTAALRAEAGLRACEVKKEFDEKFVKLSRAALRAADKRDKLRREIDQLFAEATC